MTGRIDHITLFAPTPSARALYVTFPVSATERGNGFVSPPCESDDSGAITGSVSASDSACWAFVLWPAKNTWKARGAGF